MSENTNIEWCDHTFNGWRGCTPISPGCDNCYAAAWSKRAGHDFSVPTRTKTWRQPPKWQANAAEFKAMHGRRQRVFCASLSDWLDNQVPIEWLVDLLDLIRQTPELDWLLLSKRIGNWKRRIEQAWSFARLEGRRDLAFWLFEWLHGRAPANVQIGATITSQTEADRDITKLLVVPAGVRFLSMEPLLGPVSFEGMFANTLDCRDSTNMLEELDWVIVGGESGPGARPMHPDWARSLRDQCAAAGVPFLFKQWGDWLPWHHFGYARVEDPPEQTKFKTMEFVDGEWIDVGFPDCWASKDGDIDDMQCVGLVRKKAAGRILDGRQHDEFPGGVR